MSVSWKAAIIISFMFFCEKLPITFALLISNISKAREGFGWTTHLIFLRSLRVNEVSIGSVFSSFLCWVLLIDIYFRKGYPLCRRHLFTKWKPGGCTHWSADLIAHSKVKSTLLIHRIVDARKFRKLRPVVFEGVIQETVICAVRKWKKRWHRCQTLNWESVLPS